MNNSLRRTGRTTLILLKAMTSALDGNKVVVLAETHRHAKFLIDDIVHRACLMGIPIKKIKEYDAIIGKDRISGRIRTLVANYDDGLPLRFKIESGELVISDHSIR